MALLNRSTVVLMQAARRAAAPWPLAPPPALLALLARPVLPPLPLRLARLPPPAAVGGATLLYIEDNPAKLRLVEEIVRCRPGLRLLAAPDGHLGIEMARAHLPDVILMDLPLTLPRVGGADALRVPRGDPRTAPIPLIALTACAMPCDVECGLAQGYADYLTKPLNLDQFGAAVDRPLAAGAGAAREARP